jgi:hypothetical protein
MPQNFFPAAKVEVLLLWLRCDVEIQFTESQIVEK